MSTVSTVPQQQQLQSSTVLDQIVERLRREFAAAAAAIPPTMSVDRVGTWLRWAVARDPELLRCTPASIVQAVVEIVHLNLPVVVGGLTYLVRYGTTAQAIIGWRGLVELARRSRAVEVIDSQVVYDGDEISISLGTDGARISHRPALTRGAAVAVYAWARPPGGVTIAEVMDRADVERIRRRSRAAQSGPWATDWEEMARKTVVRRLCKRLPQTPDLISAAALEPDVETAQPEARRAAVASAADAVRRAIASPTAEPASSGGSGSAASDASDAAAQAADAEAPAPKPRQRLVVIDPDGSVAASVSTARHWTDALLRRMAALAETASAEERMAFAAKNMPLASTLVQRFPGVPAVVEARDALARWLPPAAAADTTATNEEEHDA